ncbi:cyclic nucleotide-binding domain-containing protein [Streptomyces luteireticuli]|uniref:Cyclic nucleotide-binding domain-containing protein n=1 Tax=Streptomyces luteireticuli TaxID=173858 RepID=A0ABP3IVB4_9ACTN
MSRTGILAALSAGQERQLMDLAHEVSFPVRTRLFEEGGEADRFWIVRTGTVDLDLRVPGRRPAVADSVGPGGLLGWSWLCRPHEWHLGAEAAGPVRAREFEAAAVRDLCRRDPLLGHALLASVAEVIGRRLRAARARLLDH